jgi:signal transduction histidine kinase
MKRKFNFEIRITLIYLTLGVLWILLSDIFVKLLISDFNKLTQFQSFKGILFVVISSGLIYFLSQYYRRKQQLITKRLIKAKKKAEESEQLKSAFLANLSHEIRTPMNGILGFLSLLEDVNIQKNKHENFLEHIKISSERMLETLHDIIEISQIESNQSKIEVSEFNLIELMRNLYMSFTIPAGEKGLKLELKLELPGNNFLLRTDQNKLNVILKNFLKNAIKFSHQGIIEFGGYLENNRLVFYVKDNGIGIPENFQKIIFDRFTQADTTISRPYEGSGLGLSIAKAYALQLGGKIRLESKEGKGSTFWFSLPYVA